VQVSLTDRQPVGQACDTLAIDDAISDQAKGAGGEVGTDIPIR
jgi:hypothetical protein